MTDAHEEDTMKSNFSASTSTREQLLLNSAFFLLFPGFFYYHTLLGTGTTGAFLGGYFSPISLLYMLPLALVYVQAGLLGWS